MSSLADIRDKAVKEYFQGISRQINALRIDFEATKISRQAINGKFSARLERLELEEKSRKLETLEKIEKSKKTEKRE